MIWPSCTENRPVCPEVSLGASKTTKNMSIGHQMLYVACILEFECEVKVAVTVVCERRKKPKKKIAKKTVFFAIFLYTRKNGHF